MTNGFDESVLRVAEACGVTMAELLELGQDLVGMQVEPTLSMPKKKKKKRMSRIERLAQYGGK